MRTTIPSGKAAYAMRSVDAAHRPRPKTRARTSASTRSDCSAGRCRGRACVQAYALLRLCDKYGDGRVEAVCQSALAFDVVDVARITRMLKVAAKPAPAPASRKANVVQLALPRFARGPAEHFETRARSTNEGRASMSTTPTLNPELVAALKRLQARPHHRHAARAARARRQAGHVRSTTAPAHAHRRDRAP